MVFAMVLIFSSSKFTKPADNRVGSPAPALSIANGDTAISLQKMKGKYVLLTFWSSADAESRISNLTYDKIAKTYKGSLEYVAVNYDHSPRVYGEIKKIDDLRQSSQFRDNKGSSSSIYTDYRLAQGFNSYLIDRNGTIIAINPTSQQLAKMILI